MYTETKLRTLCRDVTYRLSATIVSVALVGFTSGLLVEVSKILIYYIMERIWLQFNWGKFKNTETKLRTLCRALSYRIVATFAVAYWVALDTALILAVLHTILYYINERMWLLSDWQKSWTQNENN